MSDETATTAAAPGRPTLDSPQQPLIPSPGTPGEGQGGGQIVENRVDSSPQTTATPPSPQPSPGVPAKGEDLTSTMTITLPAVTAPPGDPTEFVEQKLLEGKVIEALREIFDPEIPVNIYELGLIYEIKVEPDNSVLVKMTLTAPACPVAGTLPGDVEKRVNAIPEVKEAKVELVWDPPWTRERMSETALLTLGM